MYQNHPYFETNLYIETQPLDARKKGFGSKDAHRRDEFSNAVRTQQYRESIRKEMELRKDDVNSKMKEIMDKYQSTASNEDTLKAKRFQFDLGRSLVMRKDLYILIEMSIGH